MECKYRNCIEEIKDRKSNAIYCSKKCRENEKTYIKREKRNFFKEKKLVSELIDKASNTNTEMIELYKMIYK